MQYISYQSAVLLNMQKFKAKYGYEPTGQAQGYEVKDGDTDISDCLNNAWDSKVADLWTAANEFGESQMDNNSRTSISLMLASGTATAQQLSRINDFGVWWRNLWGYYAIQKAKLVAGEEASFDPSVVGNTPWTIWQISE
jgi:hypothetical protein